MSEAKRLLKVKRLSEVRRLLEVRRPFESRRQLVAAEEREYLVMDLEKNERYYKPAADGSSYIWGPPE
ncbi:hypothetical protein Tco_0763167 [Tanacetum coccineum]